jgi:hypothetical protein
MIRRRQSRNPLRVLLSRLRYYVWLAKQEDGGE